MDNSEKLKNDIISKLSKKYNIFNPSDTYILDIENTFSGNIYVSKIIKLAFEEYYNQEINFKEVEVFIWIYGSHDNLIIDCNFPKLAIFKDETKIQQLKIIDTEQEGNTNLIKLVFYSCKIINISLLTSVEEIISKDGFECAKLNIIFAKYFIGNINKIELYGLIEKLHISNCKIEAIDLNFKNTIFESNIEIGFDNVESNKIEIISDISIDISIKNSNINGIFAKINKNSERIIISDNECEKLEFIFGTSIIESLTLSLLRGVKKIEINAYDDNNFETPAIIENIKLLDINFIKDFQGNFTGFEVGTIKFHNVINKGEIVFAFIDFINPLEVFHSILGSTSFFNAKLTDSIKFHSSSIEEFKFYNTRVPSNILSIIIPEDLELSDDSQTAYRQLKISSDKSGNKEKSNYFRSMELDSYFSNLSFFDPKQILEKITLGLNKYSNNYGTNWLYPIGWLIILCSITFFVFLWSLGVFWYDYGLFIIDDQLYSSYIDWFIPGYLYPTRNKLAPILKCLQYQDFTSLPLLSKAIVFINDILILPYLIYQFIAAFRRHGMK